MSITTVKKTTSVVWPAGVCGHRLSSIQWVR